MEYALYDCLEKAGAPSPRIWYACKLSRLVVLLQIFRCLVSQSGSRPLPCPLPNMELSPAATSAPAQAPSDTTSICVASPLSVKQNKPPAAPLEAAIPSRALSADAPVSSAVKQSEPTSDPLVLTHGRIFDSQPQQRLLGRP